MPGGGTRSWNPIATIEAPQLSKRQRDGAFELVSKEAERRLWILSAELVQKLSHVVTVNRKDWAAFTRKSANDADACCDFSQRPLSAASTFDVHADRDWCVE